MKRILLELSCTNPDVDAASYALVEMTAEGAARLVALHARVRAFQTALADDGLASRFTPPSFGLEGYPFVALRHTEQMEEILRGKERLAELPPNMKLKNDEPDLEERVECFRALIRDDSVQLTAMSRHGDYGLRAEGLPLGLLKRISEGVVLAERAS